MCRGEWDNPAAEDQAGAWSSSGRSRS